jgi:hypothetical protein
MSDCFLSIVQPPGEPGGDKGRLLVRARVKGDIERIFARARVQETPGRDYRFRTLLPRWMVAKAMSDEVRRIAYSNFKDSVDEKDRHDAYFRCWAAMNALQRSRLAPKRPDGRQTLPFDEDWDMGFMRQ